MFIAGILIGDERAPYKGEIAHFHSALASLAEIVAFVHAGPDHPAVRPAARRGLADRPGARGPARVRRSGRCWSACCCGRSACGRGERLFVLWAGLKGAVPILLGAFIVQAGITDAPRIYEIIFVVVAFSVIVQGGTVPALARRLNIPLRTIEPEPWSLGIRFQEEPEGLHRFVVTARARRTTARPSATCRCPRTPGSASSSASGHLVPAHADTALQAGDEVIVLAPGTDSARLATLFT